jgi:hypothetical protein
LVTRWGANTARYSRCAMTIMLTTDSAPDAALLLVLESAQISTRFRPSSSVRPSRYANTIICNAIAMAS